MKRNEEKRRDEKTRKEDKTKAREEKRRDEKRKGEKVERVFGCSECDKAFTREEHLKRHAKSHTDEPVHTCEVIGCNKSYTRKERLKCIESTGIHSCASSTWPASDSAPTQPGG